VEVQPDEAKFHRCPAKLHRNARATSLPRSRPVLRQNRVPLAWRGAVGYRAKILVFLIGQKGQPLATPVP
jgi:hypothetical protein